jgi:xanthine dehydrogenase small subunit
MLTLASSAGEREVAVEDFFLDYRKTDLKAGEVIKTIHIPKLRDAQSFRTYKVSKRYDQDISAVIGAFRITLSGDKVTDVRIAYGGMAATPRRAILAEKALQKVAWSEDAAANAGSKLLEEFRPLTDHRATAAYRSRVAVNLLIRLYRDLDKTEADLEVVAL